MESHKKCLDFIQWFESVLDRRPGMLGSVADISAMFYIVDNINSILLFDQVLPRELSWIEFLIERKLVQGSKVVPVEEAWDYGRFVDLRHEYLKWAEARRAEGIGRDTKD